MSAFLQTVFRPDEICHPPVGDGRWRHRPSDVRHFTLFLGHFDVDFIDAVDPNGFKITILRDARERVVSTYDFWRSIPDDFSKTLSWRDEDAPRYAKSVSFSDFLRSDKPWVLDGISNSMARQLLGAKYKSVSIDESVATQAAVDKLLTFDWFTETASLRDDLASLADYFGVSAPPQFHLNRTYDCGPNEQQRLIQRTIPTPDDLSQIDSLNQIDAALYRIASRHCPFSTGRLRENSEIPKSV